jgi:hypothetical protein
MTTLNGHAARRKSVVTSATAALDQRYQSSLQGRGMNLRVMFAAFMVAAFGSSMMTFDALGQKQSLKEQLIGTWALVSWAQKGGDGTKVERYGTSPKGIAFFDTGGRYIITVMRSDRAKYASNALWQGNPEENKETAICLACRICSKVSYCAATATACSPVSSNLWVSL